MGITGLIPFLEKSSKRINIKDIKGSTVAIDTYCWLHKGAFACAEKLARGEETDVHIRYCLKYVNLLLSYDIKPILVFDGQHLPAKALTESRRREIRTTSKKRAAELLRLNRPAEARSYLQRCVDITHEMALQLIQACRERNVDCIVAPYEADAQMAYLNKLKIADYVITEDSDLVLFGCSNVIFKLDLNGQCLLVEAEKLHLAMGCKIENFTFDKFRSMCILSGCDYLDSLPGIGLARACKFILMTEETDMRKALTKIPAYLNMKNLEVSEVYIEDFLKAEATFKYMFVFDPIRRKMVRLNEPTAEQLNDGLCSNAGVLLDEEIAFELALGNINPFSKEKLDSWHPDANYKISARKTTNLDKKSIAKHKSIWNSDFKRHTAKQKVLSLGLQLRSKAATPKNRRTVEEENEEDDKDEIQSEIEVLSIYSPSVVEQEPPPKRYCLKTKPNDELPENYEKNNKTPTKYKHNPFAKNCMDISPTTFSKKSLDFVSPTKITPQNKSLVKNLTPVRRLPSMLNGSNLEKLSKFNRTVLDQKQKVVSRFFNSNSLLLSQKMSEKLENQTICTQSRVEESADSCTPSSNSGDSIENDVTELKTSQEQKLQEAAILYLSSPEARAVTKGEITPPRSIIGISYEAFSRKNLDNSFSVEEESMTEATADISSLLRKFNYSMKTRNIYQTEEASEKPGRSSHAISLTEEIVTLSDDTDDDNIEMLKKRNFNVKKIQVKKTTKKKSMRIGLSKTRSIDGQQSKLSMFGFQKRSSLQ